MNWLSERSSWLILLMAVTLSLFLRLRQLSFMEFKADEADNLFRALRIAGGKFSMASAVSSVGVRLPPFFDYLMAIPLLVSRDPVFATAFIALLNVAAMLLCYHMVRRFFDERSALFTALFFAVNPWQVLFSRKVWTQNALPLFVVASIYFACSAIYDEKAPYITWSLAALALAVQLHPSAFYLLPLFGVVIIRYIRRLNMRYVFLGGAVFLLTFTPYIRYQLLNDFQDIRKMAHFSKTERKGLNTEALTTPLELVSTRGFDYSLGEEHPEFRSVRTGIWPLDLLPMLILVGGAVSLFVLRGKGNFILAGWLILSIIYFLTLKRSVPNHYFQSILPLLFICMGLLLGRILTLAGPGYLRYVLYGLVAAVLTYQVVFTMQFQGFVRDKTCIRGDYGMPYRYQSECVERALAGSDPGSWKDIHALCGVCRRSDPPATRYIVRYQTSGRR